MASWSPSQSDPFTVSYMCQRQSSSPMLPSAAAMPPCAATVCERVGKTLVIQAVFSPAWLAPEPRPPPPPPPRGEGVRGRGRGAPVRGGPAPAVRLEGSAAGLLHHPPPN